MVALAELPVWAIALVCLGLAYILTVFVIALLGWLIDLLNMIPKVNIGTTFLKTVEQSVTHALGVAFNWSNHALGVSIHLLARFAEWVWHEIEANAATLALVMPVLADAVYAIKRVESLIHGATHATRGTAARVKKLEHEYHGIDVQLRHLERELHGIDETKIGKQLRSLDRQVATIENQTIPAIRQGENDAHDAITNLYDWAKGKASLLGVGTFTAAVAAVLSAVGLDWLACRSRSSVNGKSGCGLWDDIENVLGLALVTGLALDLPALIAEAQSVTPGIIDGIEKLSGLKD